MDSAGILSFTTSSVWVTVLLARCMGGYSIGVWRLTDIGKSGELITILKPGKQELVFGLHWRMVYSSVSKDNRYYTWFQNRINPSMISVLPPAAAGLLENEN